MEFVAQHPLVVLHGLTALVACAAGFSAYCLGWRRVRRSKPSGSGGQHPLLGTRRRRQRSGHRATLFPHLNTAWVANDDTWADPERSAAADGCLLA